jgi:hypothetical protein
MNSERLGCPVRNLFFSFSKNLPLPLIRLDGRFLDENQKMMHDCDSISISFASVSQSAPRVPIF